MDVIFNEGWLNFEDPFGLLDLYNNIGRNFRAQSSAI